MPYPMRPWTLRALALIDEGVTRRDELIELCTPFVPQGHAYRIREIERQRSQRRHRAVARTDRTHAVSERMSTEIHRVGARIVISNMLRGLVQNGTLTRDGDHFRRSVRS
jgi:hypothetical protein